MNQLSELNSFREFFLPYVLLDAGGGSGSTSGSTCQTGSAAERARGHGDGDSELSKTMGGI